MNDKSEKKKIPREIKELLIRVAVTAFVIWFALTFLIGVYVCHSDACAPMVKDGDLCVTWLPGTPSQGDLIVYRRDGKARFGRVAALPGDRVELTDGMVWVNGYIARSDSVSGAAEAVFPLTVPEGSVFVLSDNGSDTNDSRLYGAVPLGDCRGSVIFLMRRRGF